jgi:hypothetical protein
MENLAQPTRLHGTQTCRWHDEIPCQFAQHFPFYSWKDKTYCKAHLPLGLAVSLTQEGVDRLLNEYQDYTGVNFPAGTYEFKNSSAHKNLLHCEFADGVTLVFRHDSLWVVHSAECLGCIDIKFYGAVSLQFERSNVYGTFSVTHSGLFPGFQNRCKAWSLSGTSFFDGVNLAELEFTGSLNLDGVKLSGPVNLTGTKFPQQTTAYDLVVSGDALDKRCEGSYRDARNAFHAHRNRELEGKFFALEKRCHRNGLPNTFNYFLPRLLSWLYDKTSEYGQSYGRALVAFGLVQVLFCLGYSLFSGGRYWRFAIFGEWDSSAVAFTFSQVAKPFELAASRYAAQSKTYDDIVGNSLHLGWWQLWTALHSIVSISILALVLLALRWRFRRE